ncbi:hypothetical protein QIA37_04845 [Borrelia sp. CA_690]|nr:hypothetical protein [Borrelia sp. CA_690]
MRIFLNDFIDFVWLLNLNKDLHCYLIYNNSALGFLFYKYLKITGI